MPKLTWRTLATDSTFAAGQSNIFEFDPNNTNPTERQVMKILCPNLTQLSEYAVVDTDVNTNDGVKLRYLDSSNQWVMESSSSPILVESTKDSWIVVAPDQDYATKVYFCKNSDEKSLIPNYVNIPTIEYKIVSSITRDNFDSWRKWTIYGGSPVPLLCPVRYKPSDDSLCFIYAYKDPSSAAAGKVSLSWLYRTRNSAESDVDQGSLPIVSQYLRKGSMIVYDLEERVTILETQMTESKSEFAHLQSEVTDLNGKVTGVLTGTSKFFVSR